MNWFIVELPMPPSANNLFGNRADGKGRFKTKTYENWQTAAALTVVANVRADRRIGGPIAVSIELPETCALDIDNACKPILDALVHSRRIDDDRNVCRLTVWKARVEETVLVKVWSVPEAARDSATTSRASHTEVVVARPEGSHPSPTSAGRSG